MCKLSAGAINNANGVISVQRVSSSAFSRTVRLDYDITLPNGQQAINRFVICKFSNEALPPFKTGLSALTTELGPLSDSNIYMLKRFYLETNEARTAQTPELQSNTSNGLAAIMAHVVEWLMSVASKASLLSLLAIGFLSLARLFRALPSKGFYGISGVFLAASGALAITGIFSPLATSLAFIIGIVNSNCMLLLYSEMQRKRLGEKKITLFPWLLFCVLIAMALFLFNDSGSFTTHWLPPVLFRSIPFLSVAGYSIPTVPITLVLILVTLLNTLWPVTPFKTLSLSEHQSLQGRYAHFVVIIASTGMLSALGVLLFGFSLNPLLLGTKALLICLSALESDVRIQRLQIVITSLAIVSFEYALAPFASSTLINTASYSILIMLLLIALRRKSSETVAEE